MTSQRPPSLLVDALCAADAVYGTIIELNKLALDGRQADALHRLALLAASVEAHRPIIRGVITAQREATKLRDLSERMPGPRLVCGAFKGVPNPYPHTPHSEHHATPDTTQPAA